VAKNRKPLPGIDSVDATDKQALGGTYVPNPNKKPVKRERRVVRKAMSVETDAQGNSTITPPQTFVVGSIAHITNPLLKRTSGMACQGVSKGGCDYPATHAVRDASRPRTSVKGMCTMHKDRETRAAIEQGRELEINKLTPTMAQNIKKVQSIEEEKTNLKVAGALINQGLPEEDALAFNMRKTPGRPEHKRPPQSVTLGGAPRMSEEESLEYYKNAQKKTPPVYDLTRKPMEVKPGNKAPKVKEEDAPLGEGSGVIDDVIRRYNAGDDSWYDLAKEHNIHNLLYTREAPIRQSNQENLDKLLYTRTPERLQKAIGNVSEDQSEQITMASAQNALANKQRAIQAKRAALPGTRPGLPSRRNTPFQVGSGENKGIAAPKKGLEPPKE
jgi:hypothetical protein